MSETSDTPPVTEATPKRKLRPRTEHQMEFIEELLTNLPVGRDHMDFWYDTKQPYLIARRMRLDRPATLHFKYSTQQKRSSQILNNTRLPGYANLGNISLAQAREEASKLWVEAQAMVNRALAVQGPIPTGHRVNPDALLAPQEAVENPDHEALMTVLMDAYHQAAIGKGQERHGSGIRFADQDMLKIMDGVGIGFALGQAMKKLMEGNRLDIVKAREEFLGAIVYTAGAIVWLDKHVREKAT